MTLLGLIFAGLYLACAVRPAWFPWVLSASLPFSHSAMVVVGGTGVSPFYIGAIIATAIVGYRMSIAGARRDRPALEPAMIMLAVFGTYSALITLLGPRLFEGVPVFSPRGGIDSQVARQTPLEFGISNIAQLTYLILGIGVVLYARIARLHGKPYLALGFLLGLSLALLRAALRVAGVPWPNDLLDTMPTIFYAIYGGRLRGTFAEPSIFGAFAVTALVYFLVALRQDSRWQLRSMNSVGIAMAVTGLILARTGTALMGGALVLAVAAAAMLPRWVLSGFRGIDKAVLVLCALGVIVLLNLRAVYELTIGLAAQKVTTSSYTTRTSADSFAFDLVARTWGLGVGLGSNRPSSFATMMLSCVGIVGTACFAAVVALVVRRLLRESTAKAEAWALIAIVLAQSVAKPDLSTPTLWLTLALCLAASRALPPRADPGLIPAMRGTPRPSRQSALLN